MNDPIELFQSLADAGIGDPPYFDLHLDLGKPTQLQYMSENFIKSEPDIDPVEFKRRVKPFSGIESTFSYSMFGEVTDPEEFKAATCSLKVNSLAGPDLYIEEAKRGRLGTGFYHSPNKHFDIQLYLPSKVARELIEAAILISTIKSEWGYSERRKDVWQYLRVDLFDFVSSPNREKVGFNVIRFYAS